MAWNSPLIRVGVNRTCLGSLATLLSLTACVAFAENHNASPQIEYISPDGKFSSLSTDRMAAAQATAVFVDRDTISCSLKEGETTFIIALSKNANADRLTFLNENAAACGELRIAVSNSALPADSPKWTEVDGIVPFAHKRLFKLSMLGVETKFVRLSFHVDAEAAKSVRISNPFQMPILATAMSSNFAEWCAQSRELNLAAVSVAPLPRSGRN